MKKISTLRSAAMTALATLMTTALIGGTFAKYATTVTAGDMARVANWGFDMTTTMNFDNLFSPTYTSVAANNNEDLIAPGTSGEVSFQFAYDNKATSKPEVDYTFTVKVLASCDDTIKANPDIQFRLDNGSWGTFDNLVASLKSLSGDASGTKTYVAGTLPTGFADTTTTHTISWQWLYTDSTATDKQNEIDTALGNAGTMANVNLILSISAVQID